MVQERAKCTIKHHWKTHALSIYTEINDFEAEKSAFSFDCSVFRLTHRFANLRLTLALGLTSRTLFHAKFWPETIHHKLTRVISRVPS